MNFIYHGLMSYVWKPGSLPWGITLPMSVEAFLRRVQLTRGVSLVDRLVRFIVAVSHRLDHPPVAPRL
jgi:hypothetical protein